MDHRAFYWAEDALGQPYPQQDFAFLRRKHWSNLAAATMGFSVAASLSLAVSFSLSQSHFPDTLPHIRLATFEMAPPLPAPVQLPADLPAKPAPQPVAAAVPPANPVPVAAKEVAPVPQPVSAQSREKRKDKEKPVARSPADMPKPAPKTPVPKPEKTPTPAAAPAALPKRDAVAAMDPQRPPRTTQDAKPAPAPESPTPIGKSGEKKPVDIAPAEKLGIRDVLPDGIVMPNGRRIMTGASLPNGELLMATDPAKGMVETDRRVLVIAH